MGKEAYFYFQARKDESIVLPQWKGKLTEIPPIPYEREGRVEKES